MGTWQVAEVDGFNASKFLQSRKFRYLLITQLGGNHHIAFLSHGDGSPRGDDDDLFFHFFPRILFSLSVTRKGSSTFFIQTVHVPHPKWFGTCPLFVANRFCLNRKSVNLPNFSTL